MNKVILEDRFQTTRLAIVNARSERSHKDEHAAIPEPLILELQSILSSKVLSNLPPHFAHNGSKAGILSWLDARMDESEIFFISEQGALVGILILNLEHEAWHLAVYLGILFAEHAWGKGFASETIKGTIEMLERLPHKGDGDIRSMGLTLRAGAARTNQASIALLERLDFAELPAQSDKDTAFFEKIIRAPNDKEPTR